MFMHYLAFLHLNTKCTNMESSLTKYPLEHKTKARDHKTEVSKALRIKDMVEHKEKIPNEECNIRHDSTKHWNQHAHQGKHERKKKLQ